MTVHGTKKATAKRPKPSIRNQLAQFSTSFRAWLLRKIAPSQQETNFPLKGDVHPPLRKMCSQIQIRFGTLSALSLAATHNVRRPDKNSSQTRGWIVNGRRKKKGLSEVLRREYSAAMKMLDAGFSGGERDYCCASEDFRRHAPLACDLMGSPREDRRSGMATSHAPVYSSVQAASAVR